MAKGNSPNYQYERWISEQRTNYQTLVTYPIPSPPIALCCYSEVFIFKGFLNFIVLLDFIDFLVYFTYAYEAILWSVFCWGCNSMLRNMFWNSLLVPFLFWTDNYVSYFVYFSDLKTIYSYFITIILIKLSLLWIQQIWHDNSYQVTMNGFQVRKINEIRNVIIGSK